MFLFNISGKSDQHKKTNININRDHICATNYKYPPTTEKLHQGKNILKNRNRRPFEQILLGLFVFFAKSLSLFCESRLSFIDSESLVTYIEDRLGPSAEISVSEAAYN